MYTHGARCGGYKKISCLKLMYIKRNKVKANVYYICKITSCLTFHCLITKRQITHKVKESKIISISKRSFFFINLKNESKKNEVKSHFHPKIEKKNGKSEIFIYVVVVSLGIPYTACVISPTYW